VPVQGGLAAVVSREACWSVAHQRCRAWELAVGGAKGGGLWSSLSAAQTCSRGRRRGSSEMELMAAMVVGVERLGA
jgi:hypothetical protein